ncbi:MAG: glycerol-3-phosphate 1-O-acyltransferase PlsY [Proteobacteria bacterium]|nr:glycerol-3-phosphate 1-O-acyltransferase PlsY [Pseudomonadota bacterium]MBU1711179.1 glycerol-3-phosphate 1-O-acyltransferase PlsY [Pseudomonadota bacterium]
MIPVIILISYLVGSIPWGLVLGKLSGVDVRKSGSGNIGATNVSRLLGKKLGLLTLMGDIAKGVLPMVLAAHFFRDHQLLDIIVPACGFAAFLGHLYPVYLRFRGGKGVATALGVFLYLEPLAILGDLVVFVFVVAIWGYVSLGSLVASAAIPLLIWILGGSADHMILAALIAALIWVKHHENIRRLLNHQEKSWKKAPQDQAGGK